MWLNYHETECRRYVPLFIFLKMSLSNSLVCDDIPEKYLLVSVLHLADISMQNIKLWRWAQQTLHLMNINMLVLLLWTDTVSLDSHCAICKMFLRLLLIDDIYFFIICCNLSLTSLGGMEIWWLALLPLQQIWFPGLGPCACSLWAWLISLRPPPTSPKTYILR